MRVFKLFSVSKPDLVGGRSRNEAQSTKCDNAELRNGAAERSEVG